MIRETCDRCDRPVNKFPGMDEQFSFKVPDAVTQMIPLRLLCQYCYAELVAAVRTWVESKPDPNLPPRPLS